MRDGVVVNEHEFENSRHSSPSRSPSDQESEIPHAGDLLVVRRMLGQVLKPFDESQRENIFHTRCLINDRLCSLIVDGGSCANVASTRVVDKPGMSNISHAKAYKLQWLSEVREIVPTSPRSSTQRLTSDIVHRHLVMEGDYVRWAPDSPTRELVSL